MQKVKALEFYFFKTLPIAKTTETESRLAVTAAGEWRGAE